MGRVSSAADSGGRALAEAQIADFRDARRQARAALETSGLEGEVVVVDNSSADGSAALAEAAGAHVVLERERGYGSAYLAGLRAARGRYCVMADADDTYDLTRLG